VNLRSGRGCERGSTLIEVLVALVIFGGAIVGFAVATTSARRNGDSSRFEAEATTLAIDKLEELRTLESNDAELSVGAHADGSNPLRPDGTPGGVYTRTWQVTNALPTSGMRRVEMRVRWPSPLGERSVLLVSAFTSS
jgi:prepilin-type N-terminal cleavage/methylation domain-containing protein